MFFHFFSVELGQDNNVGTIRVGSQYPWNRNWRGKMDAPESMDDATLPPESETPPPGWMSDAHSDSSSPSDAHSHSSVSDVSPEALQLYDDHHRPFVIYDAVKYQSPHDDHHIFFDHHHDYHHEIITTTTPPPPTEAPLKPAFARYHLRLKIWYFNLAWGIWFVSYCAWLILKSIGRRWVSTRQHLFVTLSPVIIHQTLFHYTPHGFIWSCRSITRIDCRRKLVL